MGTLDFQEFFLGTFDDLWSAMSHINNVKIRFCDQSQNKVYKTLQFYFV